MSSKIAVEDKATALNACMKDWLGQTNPGGLLEAERVNAMLKLFEVRVTVLSRK